MPNIKSAKKRVKVIETKTLKNQMVKSALKTQIKKFEAAAAASLHEFAKETFQTWKTSGVFMRRRALNALRERAGFRLESHRIGNYVAKTFDLMNEAQVRFATAQQRLFSSDVRFKVKPGLHARAAEILASLHSSSTSSPTES